ncbi:MAG: YiiX/YebB-like N1pC/P60 family cysteine hydrolase [Gammaproteobacteria bacterium]
MGSVFAKMGKSLATYLNKPVFAYDSVILSQDGMLEQRLRVGDVLLVEGNRRISSAIKYLTQSTWSHSALCVGNLPEYAEQKMLIEADLENGVLAVPASKYARMHTRICRPVGISDVDIERLRMFVIERIGQQYDMKNVVDLLRYLFPTPPVPIRWRRKMLSLGSGDPTRAICSTIIAQAFQSIKYPILPTIERRDNSRASVSRHKNKAKVWYFRHHSLFTPRDFDVSPYFKIIKPTLGTDFDYKSLVWQETTSQQKER